MKYYNPLIWNENPRAGGAATGYTVPVAAIRRLQLNFEAHIIAFSSRGRNHNPAIYMDTFHGSFANKLSDFNGLK